MGFFVLIWACVMGIRSIWKTKKIEGEGDIFKNRDILNKE
jgi:hypothetical protein